MDFVSTVSDLLLEICGANGEASKAGGFGNDNSTPSSSSSSIKALLMDSSTISTISVCCPQSTLMAHGVYIFETLENVQKGPAERPMSFVTCICILRPDEANVRTLIREIQNPRYGSYKVYFSQKIGRQLVKSLAESDYHEKIVSVNEVPLDFSPLESHVFTLNFPPENLLLNDTGNGVQGLLSSLQAMETCPKVCYPTRSTKCARYAEAIRKQEYHLAETSRRRRDPGTVLLILDRFQDPVTPLLTQWTYQSMIHEIFGIRNNIINLEHLEDVPSDLRKCVISAQGDEFYRRNMYKNFGEIGEVIKTLVHDYQQTVMSHKKIESIGDIRDFVSNYPEFKKMSGTVSKHVFLIGELSKLVTSAGLLPVSEYEQNLVSGSTEDEKMEELTAILTEQTGLRKEDAERLLGLYFLRKNSHVVAAKLNRLVKDIPSLNPPRIRTLLAGLERIAKSMDRRMFEEGSGSMANKQAQKFLKGLRGIENVYTQHSPLIKDYIEDLLKGRFDNERLTYGPEFAFSKNVLVYVIGGLTYEETRVVAEMNKEYDANITLGGCCLWRSGTFLEYAIGVGRALDNKV